MAVVVVVVLLLLLLVVAVVVVVVGEGGRLWEFEGIRGSSISGSSLTVGLTFTHLFNRLHSLPIVPSRSFVSHAFLFISLYSLVLFTPKLGPCPNSRKHQQTPRPISALRVRTSSMATSPAQFPQTPANSHELPSQ